MNQSDNYSVYVHENKINHKRYVGITKQELNERWHNGKNYKESPRFYNAIKKYGWNNFDHYTVASGLSQEEASEMEISLIRKWNLQDDQYGYNIKDGGQGGPIAEETKIKIGNANRGRKATEKTREILSKAHMGRKHTEEERMKISKANKGKKKPDSWVQKRIGLKAGDKHPLYGKSPSAETRQKMSDALKQYYSEHPFPAKPITKRVRQIETNMIFDSIQDAANASSVCRSSISECCAGKRKTAGGFLWEFVL